jgi:hypothetical protein
MHGEGILVSPVEHNGVTLHAGAGVQYMCPWDNEEQNRMSMYCHGDIKATYAQQYTKLFSKMLRKS